jgi:predicted DNA-binding protein
MTIKENDRLEIRISTEEKEKLEAYAKETGKDKSKIIREHIESLPDPRNK